MAAGIEQEMQDRFERAGLQFLGADVPEPLGRRIRRRSGRARPWR
jgi:hypothetical protein